MDRTLKPDILCNTIKQGITNENHAEFGDKLIDFSGNGRDIQLNNIAWNKESGIDDDGALRLDGVNDFGKVTGMPIYKDYTVVADREIIDGLVENADGGVALKGSRYLTGAFCFDYKDAAFSFGTPKMIPLDTKRFISYQSKYVSNGISINIGTATDNDELWIGRLGNDERYSKIAIRFLMSFPYSMSEFLIERQLKKHKLGTLYPDMVEFRPVIKSNASYDNIVFYYKNEKVENGTYLTVGSSIGMHIRLSSSPVNEIKSITVNGIPATFKYHDANNNIYQYDFNLTSKSPQNINITIDEYIRFEDIKQPYPVIFQVKDRHTSQIYNYGDKIKVGSSIQLSQGEKPNLLSGLYSIKSYEYEGKTYSYNQLTNLNIILTKQSISLSCNKTWLLDDNEPKCILSPRLLSIPNSSYKILGYIPDISGHGNNGVINNSAYAEGSGVNEDGSYQFDGVDDFVTIPTVTGGKQVLMKVNWQSDVGAVTLYDQRLNISDYEFAIYNGTRDLDDNPVMAYQGRNNGQTYIDGILNSNIMASELKAITHNITITNELSLGINNTYPVIGSTRSNTHFAQMSLYDFMLFDEISTDDKIKELNEYVGIEAKVELPPYYWDTYGKTNLDADKATIQQRGVAVGNYDLTNYNHAYDKMSGYGGYKFAKFDNELDWYLTPDNGYIDVVSRNGYSITLRNLSTSNYGWYFQNSTVKEFITKDIPFKVKANKSIRVYWDMHSYKSNGENFGYVVNNITLNPNEDTSINLRHLTEEELTELDANKDRMYYLLWFDLSTLAVDEEVTIEMLPLYPNGLLYDGVTDYSENVNIHTFNDFTLLVKASLLNGFIGSGGSIAKKGNNNKVIGGGYDFIYALDSSTIEDNRNSYWPFGAALRVSNGAINPPLIGYMTKNNVNGVPMSSGANPSIEGITFSKWEGYIKMVLYKAMLYPKTIPLLQINFLKNLMEKDEIIDLNNKIFIQE